MRLHGMSEYANSGDTFKLSSNQSQGQAAGGTQGWRGGGGGGKGGEGKGEGEGEGEGEGWSDIYQYSTHLAAPRCTAAWPLWQQSSSCEIEVETAYCLRVNSVTPGICEPKLYIPCAVRLHSPDGTGPRLQGTL